MTSNFFKGFLTYLPTHVRFCPIEWVLFYLVVSDFRKPTYLSKNRTSYVDGPLQEKKSYCRATLRELNLIWD